MRVLYVSLVIFVSAVSLVSCNDRQRIPPNSDTVGQGTDTTQDSAVDRGETVGEHDTIGAPDLGTEPGEDYRDDWPTLPPDVAIDETGRQLCLQPTECRLDHTCNLTTLDEMPYCVDRACSAEPDRDINECGQDLECPVGDYCLDGRCVLNSCTDDCECGRFGSCDGESCDTCLPTCSTNEDCDAGYVCSSYGFGGSCTRCDGCPLPVSSTSGQVTTAVISTSPVSYLNAEVTVVGTLTTSPGVSCDDDGICGSCYPGLALDGVIALRGSTAPGYSLCDQRFECHEQVDSCLPKWECWPFPIGTRVRARGIYRQISDELSDRPWWRLAEPYRLDVSAIQPVDPVEMTGTFVGTLEVVRTRGADCGTLPEMTDIEIVIAHSSEGMLVEFMETRPYDGRMPIHSGWHTGQLDPDGQGFNVNTPNGLGGFTGALHSRVVEGEYQYSLSGPHCFVASEILAEQIR